MKIKPFVYNTFGSQIGGTELYGITDGKTAKEFYPSRSFLGHCYQTAQHQIQQHCAEGELAWVLYRLTNMISRETADWFLDSVIKASLPDRLKEVVQFKKVKSWIGKLNERNDLPWGSYRGQPTEEPWLRLILDPWRMKSEDAFAAMAFCRMVQSYPEVVNYAKYVYDEFAGKLTPSEAFMVATSQFRMGLNTSAVFHASGFGGEDWQKKLKNFTYKDAWEKLKSMPGVQHSTQTPGMWKQNYMRLQVDCQMNPAWGSKDFRLAERFVRNDVSIDPLYVAAVKSGKITIPKLIQPEEVINVLLGNE